MTGTSLFRLLGVWALAGVASAAAPQIQTGQGAETTFDGLARVDNTIMDAVWVRPDIDLRGFRKVLFVPVGVSYRDVEPSDAAFSEEVAASEAYEVVDEAGPDVPQIGVALLDVVSRVPPQAATQPRVYIESVEEASLVLEIRGSMSNSVYLRAVDRRAAARQSEMIESNRVTNASEIRRLGRRWGEIVRKGLETLLTEGAGT
jgi:hypothetical protein